MAKCELKGQNKSIDGKSPALMAKPYFKRQIKLKLKCFLKSIIYFLYIFDMMDMTNPILSVM